VAENRGGFVSSLIIAKLWAPELASVGTSAAVMVKQVGAINQYPLVFPVKVDECAGNVIGV
jgi:hypothetical protein